MINQKELSHKKWASFLFVEEKGYNKLKGKEQKLLFGRVYGELGYSELGKMYGMNIQAGGNGFIIT